MKVKVLTLQQPWATLIAEGYKKIETRSWNTSYRGEVYIHASKTMNKISQSTCKILAQVFKLQCLYDFLESKGLFGYILAKATIEYVEPTEDVMGITKMERAFGDYTPGRYAWFLKDVVQLETPIPAKGNLNLWNFDISSDTKFKT